MGLDAGMKDADGNDMAEFRRFQALQDYVVENFSVNGIDDQRDISLNRFQLEQIFNKLLSVTRDNAADVFPAEKYDDRYFQDVRDGIKVFGDLIQDYEHGMKYWSWW